MYHGAGSAVVCGLKRVASVYLNITKHSLTESQQAYSLSTSTTHSTVGVCTDLWRDVTSEAESAPADVGKRNADRRNTAFLLSGGDSRHRDVH